MVAECPKAQPCPRCQKKGHRERDCPEVNHGPGTISRGKKRKHLEDENDEVKHAAAFVLSPQHDDLCWKSIPVDIREVAYSPASWCLY